MGKSRRTKTRGPRAASAKRPKGSAPASSERTPKTGLHTSATHSGKPVFCFHYADRATPHSWQFSPEKGHAQELFGFICEMARLSWREIERQQAGGHRKHHSQGIETFVADAQADIRRTRLDEIFGDAMFRFRLSGKKRLWGFRSETTFHVVWWDWDHKVYPTDPG